MIKSIITRFPVVGAGLVVTSLIGTSLFVNNAAYAVTAKECHQQFTTAKKAGTVKGQTFKEYKEANCKVDTSVKEKSHQQDVKKSDTSKENAPASKSATKQETTASNVATGDAVFPNVVDSKYAKEKDGTARMHTCLDQYKANKANNKNGDLKWIQKGGGYYSECVKRLKSSSAK